MWQIPLSVSKLLLLFCMIFYCSLGYLLVTRFWHSQCRYLISIIAIMLIIEIWRAITSALSVNGILTIIVSYHQIYWKKRRWHFYYKPLFLPNAVLLNLISLHGNKRITLLLCCDHTDKSSWRQLCYLMRYIILTWPK